MPDTIDQVFNRAVEQHQAGELSKAEQIYRQILGQHPNHAGALHLLGVIALQVGRHDDAIELIKQAIARQPNSPQALCNLGVAFANAGKLDDSISALRRAIALNGDMADSHINLGVALKDKGQLDEAIAAFKQAIALNPNYAEAYNNLGNAFQEKSQFDEAIAAIRSAIARKPGYFEAHLNLGLALHKNGQFSDAISAFRQAVFINSGSAETYRNLGIAFQASGNITEAIAAFRQAIATQPNYPQAHNNLGIALAGLGKIDEAIAAFTRAIAMKADYFEAFNNLGVALQASGKIEESIAGYRKAIGVKSDFADAHYNLGLTLLTTGDFLQGWDEYEWRWRCRDFPSPARNFPQPMWKGQPLSEKKLLVHAEQGLGDTLQFVRYLPMVMGRVGNVVIECQPELVKLVRSIAGDCVVVAQGNLLPAFDVQCPLLSLPRAMKMTLENIPADIPYLHADAELSETWRERLSRYSDSFKVGFVWAGSKTHKNDRNRSIALAAFAPLAQVHGVSLHSLQKREPGDQADPPAEGFQLFDWNEYLHDFSDTAALIANIDLVISVDTAVVHLAGAMGKPVWALIPFAPDWRWMLRREDSPWYPTMRLFRQTAIGDWQSVMQRVRESLTTMARARRANE